MTGQTTDNRKKRVLCIAVRNPYPVSGGDQVRLAQQLELLTALYDVDLLYITHDRNVTPATENLPALRSEHAFYIPRWRRYLQALRFVTNRLPISVNHHTNRRVCRTAARMARGNAYDILFVNTPLAAVYARGVDIPIRLMDAVDSFAMNSANGLRKTRTPFRKLWYTIQTPRLLRFEKECLRQFDRLSFISEIDRHYVDPEGTKSCIVGNYVDTEYWCPARDTAPEKHGAPTITFMGKMNYEPNVLAVTSFADNILPELRRRYPDVQFRIIGGRPTDPIKALGTIPGITVTGFVDDPRPLLRESDIVVAPMLSGSGIQNKILFAMSAGCCVVTTPLGAEGMVPAGEALAVCPPEEMAAHIASLFDDKARHGQMGKAARRYILDNYSRDIIFRQFRAFVGESPVEAPATIPTADR